MAPRKKAAAVKAKARTPVANEAPPTQESQTTSAGNSNRLLRGAAWARMFGRIESKSPFNR